MNTVTKEIQILRNEIDKLDQEILEVIEKRIRVTEKIGQIKKTHNSEILDKERESEILSGLIATGKEFGIDEKFIISLWRQIIDYSYKVQKERE